MNVTIIHSDPVVSNWLLYSLKLNGKFDVVDLYSSVSDIEFDDLKQHTILVIHAPEFTELTELLQDNFGSQEVPFPIFVLSASFDEDINVSELPDLTIDVFPVNALTPEIFTHLVVALKRDFDKDNILKNLAHFDALTGATNRHLFEDRIKQALSRSKRTHEPVSLVYFDLDKFKEINDSYGHQMGDDYLKRFVQIVKNNIREVDTLGRLGGDEFGLLLTRTGRQQSEIVLNNIMAALSKPHLLNGLDLPIKTSIGVVCYSGDETTDVFELKTISQYADDALYKAKKAGRNTIVYFELPS